jgi:ABC-type glutathione transport system ATPase component
LLPVALLYSCQIITSFVHSGISAVSRFAFSIVYVSKDLPLVLELCDFAQKMSSGCKKASPKNLLILSVYVSTVLAAKSSLFPHEAIRSAVKKPAEHVGLNCRTASHIIGENERSDEFCGIEKIGKCLFVQLRSKSN